MDGSWENHLLPHILLKLSPDVFFHPLWLNCFPKTAADSYEVIDRLEPSIQRLMDSEDYRNAAQLLLVCAVLQKRYGDPLTSLLTTQKVWDLGESHKMPEIAGWAAWGACAIFADLGEFCKAAEYLERLEGLTHGGNDWILTTTLKIVKNILLEHQSDQDGIQEIFSWMSGWGEPLYAISIAAPSNGSSKLDDMGRSHLQALPRFSRAWWAGLIRIMIGYFTGRQRLWVNSNGRAFLKYKSIDGEHEHSPSSHAISPEPAEKLPVPILASDNAIDEPHDIPGEPTHISSVQEPPHERDSIGLKLSMKIYCLGTFRLYQNEVWIYRWVSRKALSVLKYLVVHHPTPVSKDALMDSLWPDADAESARRNLHQAIYTLRQTLKEGAPEFQHVLFEKEQYFLNPEMEIWMDFIEFEGYYHRGQQMEHSGRLEEAIQAYIAAQDLYRGDFMVDDLYEDLPIARRQYFWEMYLSNAYRLSNLYLEFGQTRAAIHVNQRVLGKDKTQEPAYQNLMKCYIHLGQRNLAIRQYQNCVKILKEELDIPPSAETRAIYQEIIQM